MPDFKPNIMPILYWGLAFGATAGVVMWILTILARYIGFIWFPVFLIGVAWGAWRNYQRQKQQWYAQGGVVAPAQPITQEFRQAASDIAIASRELFDQEAPADTQTTPTEDVSSEQNVPPQGM